MGFELDSTRGNGAQEPWQSRDPDDIDLRTLLTVMREHLLWIVLAAALLGGATLMREQRKVPTYTATLTLQYRNEQSPIEALSGLTPSLTQDVSQIELLRGLAVMRTVVENVGFRLRLHDAEGSRSELLSQVSIEASAAPGRYRAERKGRGYTVSTADGEIVSEASEPGVIAGPGFSLQLKQLPELVEFSVMDAQDAAESLRDQLKIEPVGSTTLIRVKYTHPDAQTAAGVLDALAYAYQEHSANRNQQNAARRREFIAQRFLAVADSLSRAEAALSNYQQQTATIDPGAEGLALSEQLNRLETELRTYRFQETTLQSLIAALRSPDDDAALRRLVALSGDVLPAGPELYGKLEGYVAERRRLTSSRLGYRPGSVRVEAVDSAISATKAEIRGVAEQSTGLLRLRRQETERQLADIRGKVGALPARASGYVQLQQRVEAVQKMFDVLAQRYYEAQIAEAVDASALDVVDPPIVPNAPDPSTRNRNVALALILGVMLGVAGAFAREFLDVSIRRVGDVERASRLDLLALVPDVPHGARNGRSALIADGDEPNGAEEAVNYMLTALRFTRVDPPRLLAITSSVPGEGKTSLAINLARAGAHMDRSVLLIDADLRRPAVHGALGIPQRPGLSDVLIGELALEGAIRHVPELGCDVLTCGTRAPHPAQLLGDKAAAELLESLRSLYDLVIVDTAPVLVAADTLTLAPHVEGVILLTQFGQTSRVALARAADQLRRVNAPLLGAVVNRVPESPKYGRYSGDHGYYQSSYSQYAGYGEDGGAKNGHRKRLARR